MILLDHGSCILHYQHARQDRSFCATVVRSLVGATNCFPNGFKDCVTGGHLCLLLRFSLKSCGLLVMA